MSRLNAAGQPLADAGNGVPAAAGAPPRGRTVVLACVDAAAVLRARRPCSPDRVHDRVLRVVRDHDQGRHRVLSGRGIDSPAGAAGRPGIDGDVGRAIPGVQAQRVGEPAGAQVRLDDLEGLLQRGQPAGLVIEARLEEERRQQLTRCRREQRGVSVVGDGQRDDLRGLLMRWIIREYVGAQVERCFPVGCPVPQASVETPAEAVEVVGKRLPILPAVPARARPRYPGRPSTARMCEY